MWEQRSAPADRLSNTDLSRGLVFLLLDLRMRRGGGAAAVVSSHSKTILIQTASISHKIIIKLSLIFHY